MNPPERSSGIIIAHRGASGYLPEHTLQSKAFAHALGADYLEQDVVATADGELIVLHDIHLEQVSDVTERFPDRGRSDGRYYAIDFSLEEIRQLSVYERTTSDGTRTYYPGRFPHRLGQFRIVTLDEEFEFIQSLNRSTGRVAGVYTEIKRPAWHRDQGIDITPLVLRTMADHGYRQRGDPVYLQCFDDRELMRIRQALRCDLALIQLIADDDSDEANTDFARLRTRTGLHELAGYADGIGPKIQQVITGRRRGGGLKLSSLVELAHVEGLCVHPYTFRIDDLPDYVDNEGQLLGALFDAAGVDGLFTDFPDVVRRFLDRDVWQEPRP